MKTLEILYYSTRLGMVMMGSLFVLGGCWGEPRDDIGSSIYSITSILLDPGDCNVNVLDQVDCNTVYVATNGNGIYKSLDGGQNWQRASDGLFEWNITEMVMDPSNPSVLYAGTENSGLFQTLNGGAAWVLTPDAGLIRGITSIAIDASTCQTGRCTDVYVGSEESGILYSKDVGFTWTEQNSGLDNPAIVTALTVDSYTSGGPSVLYAGTEGGHIYKWNNSQWEETIPNLSDATNARPLVIAVNPIVPSEIFVGTSGGEGQSIGGTFSSTSGSIWTQEFIPGAQNFSVREIVFCIQIALQCAPTRLDILTPNNDPLAGDDVLYAGVFGLSINFFSTGDAWTTVFMDFLIGTGNNITSLAIDPLRHTTLYAGTLEGFIVKSPDPGTPTSWERIDIDF